MREKKEEQDLIKIVDACGHQNMTGPRVSEGQLEFWCIDCGYLARCAVLGETAQTSQKLDEPKQDRDET